MLPVNAEIHWLICFTQRWIGKQKQLTTAEVFHVRHALFKQNLFYLPNCILGFTCMNNVPDIFFLEAKMSENLWAFLTNTGSAAALIPRSTSRMRSMSVVRALISSKQAMVQMGTKWSLSIWDIRYRSFDRFSLQTPKTISVFFLVNF